MGDRLRVQATKWHDCHTPAGLYWRGRTYGTGPYSTPRNRSGVFHESLWPFPLNASAATAYDAAQATAKPQVSAKPAEVVRGEDQVELSSAARILAGQNQPAEIREDLVSRIRGEIADGTYETADKLDATISRLARDLG